MKYIYIKFGYDTEYSSDTPECDIFKKILTETLYRKNYVLNSLVYSKTQSYSTIFVDDTLLEDLDKQERKIIENAIDEAFNEYLFN